MKLIPSILADDIADFRHKLDIAARVCGEVQIDVMDGKFVSHKSLDLEEIVDTFEGVLISRDIHVMELHPEARIEISKNILANRFIFHFEAAGEPEKILSTAREAGLAAGLALNPETSISEIKHLVPSVDLVMFLAINPGELKSKFIPEIVEKVSEFKQRFPEVLTAIDGGVELENITFVEGSQADIAYIGRGMYGTDRPVEIYEKMSEKINP